MSGRVSVLGEYGVTIWRVKCDCWESMECDFWENIV